jgi:hypothetical protein
MTALQKPAHCSARPPLRSMGDEDYMWRPLRTLRDGDGRAYSCRYNVIAKGMDFYSRMVCASGARSVVARVNSAS